MAKQLPPENQNPQSNVAPGILADWQVAPLENDAEAKGI